MLKTLQQSVQEPQALLGSVGMFNELSFRRLFPPVICPRLLPLIVCGVKATGSMPTCSKNVDVARRHIGEPEAAYEALRY
jgi:hypothetical protein